MSSIKLTADSGGGTFEIKAPSSSGNTRILTLPDTENLTLGKPGILQVKQAVKTDTSSYSTGSSTLADSYFDIVGLSITLTPSSGTKCLVSYDVNLGGEGNYRQGIAMIRDSTQIYLGDANGSRQRLSSFNYTSPSEVIDDHGGSFLDTHGADGSTAVTYKLQIYVATPGRTSRVNRAHSESDNRETGRVVSSLTVMEVAA